MTATTVQKTAPEAGSSSGSKAPSRTQWILYWTAVFAIFALTIGGSLYWINRNIVLIGRDAGGHLTATLQQAELLRHLSPQSFLMALSFDDYRPPAFYLFTQPLYALLGYSADVAQLQNVFWLALILGLTFFFGWRFTTPFVALLALALTAFMPMLAGMTRMFYTESFITAMVMLNLLALVQSEGFTRRGWSLLWGASAGLGLLVKWTFPIYVLIPVLLVLWPMLRGLRGHQPQTPQHKQGNLWRSIGVSLVVAGGLTALLMALTNEYVATLLLGRVLFPIWFVLIAVLIFLLQRHPSPWINLMTSVVLLLLIASVWYLTRVEFATAFFDAAYGTYGGRRSQAFNPLNLRYYTRNWIYLWQMHLGPLFAVLLLPAVIAWIADLRHWRSLPRPTQLLWGSVASTFLFLTFAAQGNERNLVPLLPILALLAAMALLRFSRFWRIGLATIWVLVLGLQWATLTIDALEPFAEATASLWVDGEYAVRPASGETHPDFWIAPDVLARVAQNPPDGFPASLGILVNSKEIHRSPFRYLVRTQGLPVEVRTLGEIDMRGIGDVFANQYVLIKDGDNRDVEAPGRAAIARLQAGDSLFTLLYTVDQQYDLPNGETAWLYRRVGQWGHPYTDQQMRHSADVMVEHINRWWNKDAALLIPTIETGTWLGIGGLGDELSDATIIISDHVDAPETAPALQNADVIFAVTDRYSQPLKEALAQVSVKALEVGDENLALSVYGRRNRTPFEKSIGEGRDGTMLAQVSAPQQVGAGEVLVVDLRVQGDLRDTRRLSLRIVDESGATIAQNDQTVAENVTAGLFVPPGTEPGAYTVLVVMYDLPDMTLLSDGDETPEIELMQVEVLAEAE